MTDWTDVAKKIAKEGEAAKDMQRRLSAEERAFKDKSDFFWRELTSAILDAKEAINKESGGSMTYSTWPARHLVPVGELV